MGTTNLDINQLKDGTDGELITWDSAGAPDTVAAGTADQVLTSNGAGAAPTFQDAGGGVTPSPETMVITDEFVGPQVAWYAGGNVAGDLGWKINGTNSNIHSESGHPGISRITTTATTNNVAALSLIPSRQLFVASDTFDATFIIRLNNSTCGSKVGFSFNTTQAEEFPSAEGIYFEKLIADSNWFVVTRTSATQTRTDTTIAVSTNFIKFRIRRIDASTIGFTVNDGTEIEHTTNIPTGALHAQVPIETGAAAAKTIDIDFFQMAITGLTR